MVRKSVENQDMVSYEEEDTTKIIKSMDRFLRNKFNAVKRRKL